MIERAFFGIAGPPRAGKTLLAERLLASCPGILMAGRFRPERALRRFVEDARGNDETRRYALAGASETLLLRHPPAGPQEVADEFWETEFITNYSEAVVLEAAPLSALYFNTAFFVLRPLASAARLLTRKRVALRTAVEEIVHGFGPGPLSDALRGRIPGMLREFRASIQSGSDKTRSLERMALRPAYADLPNASVIVINVRGRSEAAAAERTAALLRGLWEDESQRREVLGPLARPRPPRLAVANLADDRDPALRGILARARRTIGEIERAGSRSK